MVSPDTAPVYLCGVKWNGTRYLSMIYKIIVIVWNRMYVDGFEHRLLNTILRLFNL